MKKAFFIIGIIGTSFIAVMMILYAVYVIWGIVLLGGGFNPRISPEKMEEIFAEDYELLMVVVQFMIDTGHEKVRINRDDMENSEMFVYSSEELLKIEDINVKDSIKELRKRKYSVIGRKDNTIYFLRWSIRDNGRGIAFSVDGSEPTLQFLTKIVSLPNPNWYYYEEDYNEWRVRNKNPQ